jgi:hypothetical protein
MCMSDCRRVLEIVIGFFELSENLTTSNCSAGANSHTIKFTTAHTKCSQFAVSSPRVAW